MSALTEKLCAMLRMLTITASVRHFILMQSILLLHQAAVRRQIRILELHRTNPATA
jgi:hypothetical protein